MSKLCDLETAHITAIAYITTITYVATINIVITSILLHKWLGYGILVHK